jgi:predicted Zn-dependent protease
MFLLSLVLLMFQIPLAAQGRNTPDRWGTANTSAAETAGFSPEDVYFLGRAVAADIVSRYRLYKQNRELSAYLNKICNALVINSPVKAPGMYNGCHVQVLDTGEVNAFASPGGHIFITRGLIDCAASEDVLAAVIAHEIAHIQLEHAIALINDEEIKLMLELDNVARQSREKLSRMRPVSQRMTSLQETAQAMMDALFTNGYSRMQEFEADVYALSLLSAAGYQPPALMEFLRVLEQRQARSQAKFYPTHPAPSLRINNIQRQAQNRNTQNTGALRQDRFREIVKGTSNN